MALSEKSRSSLFEAFSKLAGEEPVSEMLSHFPARDVEEPVTKEFLRAELAELRTEIAELRTELRTELAASISMQGSQLQAAMNQQLRWMVGTMIAIAMVTISLAALVG